MPSKTTRRRIRLTGPKHSAYAMETITQRVGKLKPRQYRCRIHWATGNDYRWSEGATVDECREALIDATKATIVPDASNGPLCVGDNVTITPAKFTGWLPVGMTGGRVAKLGVECWPSGKPCGVLIEFANGDSYVYQPSELTIV